MGGYIAVNGFNEGYRAGNSHYEKGDTFPRALDCENHEDYSSFGYAVGMSVSYLKNVLDD